MKLADLNPTDKIKILAYGDSGNGKTCFAVGFPGPIFIHDFDNKVSSAAGYLGAKDPKKLAEVEYEAYPGFSDYSKFYTKLVEHEGLAAKGQLPFKTIVLDSLTTFQDSLLREVMRQNPGIKGAAPGVPGLQHYSIMNVKFKEQLGKLLALPANIVVTAHIKQDKDENTGEILRRPSLSGQLATYLPIVFGEVYRLYAESKDGKTIYRAQTKSDAKFICRSQIQGLPDHIESYYDNLVRR